MQRQHWIIAGLLSAAIVVGYAVLAKAHAGSWTGCYVGGVGGYSALVQDEYGIGAQGPAIAGTVGCDLQRDKLVFGVLGEYGFGQFDIYGETLDAEGWALGGRGGVLLWDHALLYGVIKWTDMDLSADNYSGEASLTGPVVGAGLEAPLGGGFFTRLEYNYGLLEIEEGGDSEDINTHSGRLGFIYKFGGTDPLAAFESKPLK